MDAAAHTRGTVESTAERHIFRATVMVPTRRRFPEVEKTTVVLVSRRELRSIVIGRS